MMHQIAFNDLKAQYARLRDEINAGIAEVIEGSHFISGPQVERLERELCAYTGSRFCVTCSSGTDALLLPLLAKGVGAGDAVFVPAFTFFATAEVASFLSATPVFCDVKEDTFNIDPASLREQIARVRREGRLKPRAVIAVDLFGLPAEYPELQSICEEFGLLLIEDAAQGFGGAIEGRRAGTFGNAAGTSFFPAKALGCYGDGGAVFTDDEALYQTLVSLRVHGKGSHKYENVRIGMNARLDTLQAAILLPKLRVFDDETRRRVQAAALYARRIGEKFRPQAVPEGYYSSVGYYTLRAGNNAQRERALAVLKQAGIPAMVYYPIPLHLQKVYEPLGYRRGDLPVAERLCDTVFSLPMHAYLSDGDIERICAVLEAV